MTFEDFQGGGGEERVCVCVCLFTLSGFYVLVCHITLVQVNFGLLGIHF